MRYIILVELYKSGWGSGNEELSSYVCESEKHKDDLLKELKNKLIDLNDGYYDYPPYNKSITIISEDIFHKYTLNTLINYNMNISDVIKVFSSGEVIGKREEIPQSKNFKSYFNSTLRIITP